MMDSFEMNVVVGKVTAWRGF